MSRRSSLPGADELFRTTSAPSSPSAPAPPPAASPRPGPTTSGSEPADSGPNRDGERRSQGERDAAPERELSPVRAVPDPRESLTGRGNKVTGSVQRSGSGVRRVSRARSTDAEHQPSGRERHDEKITVYVSPQELLELERARWVLRAEHGLASDRGRIVREAVAVVLADLEAKGAHSILVTRLQELENR